MERALDSSMFTTCKKETLYRLCSTVSICAIFISTNRDNITISWNSSVLCEYWKILDRIKYLVTIRCGLKPIQLLQIFKYLFVCNTMKGLCLSKKMCLSAVLLLTMVMTLDSSWSLCIGPLWTTKYWKITTAFLQHKPQTGCHKTVRKLLNKKLLMATFEKGKNHLIWFEI